jgi:hypothetical protein
MKRAFIILYVLVASGCATVGTAHRPDDYYRQQAATEEENGQLFSDQDSLLSDKDIERILDYRVKLPNKSRVAILKLSKDNYWRFYSNDFAQLSDSVATEFIGELRRSSRVYDASYLPSMLVPDKRTVPFLREAAARYQADLLLAYRSDCRSFEKYRVIRPNETKLYCTLEAVLLDVRSGIVPFTVVSSNESSGYQNNADTNFRETIAKAEMEAVTKCLGDVAKSINKFLESVDRL